MNKFIKMILDFVIMIGKNLLDEVIVYLLNYTNKEQDEKIRHKISQKEIKENLEK